MVSIVMHIESIVLPPKQTHERSPAILEKIDSQRCWPPPIFMVIISIVELGVSPPITPSLLFRLLHRCTR